MGNKEKAIKTPIPSGGWGGASLMMKRSSGNRAA